MKKLALILALMLIPCTAFGLEMLNDNSLEQVTGQHGVSIAVDDIQLFLHVDRFAYIDCDGYSTNSNYGGTCESTIGAGFVVSDFQMDTININMIGLAGSLAITEASSGLDATQMGVVAALGGNAAGGVGYGLAFTENATSLYDNGSTFYRNPGHQTLTAVTGYGMDTAGIDDGTYAGSLMLASATCGSIPLFYDYGNTDTTNGCALDGTAAGSLGLNHYTNTNNVENNALFHPQALTIDLTGRLPLHTTGMATALDPGSRVTIAGVLIGLPTMEIHIQEILIGDMVITANITSNTAAEEALVKNNNRSFGAIQLEGVTFTTFGGWMEIAPTFY